MITSFMPKAKEVMRKYALNIFKLEGYKGYYALRGIKFHKLSTARLKRLRAKPQRGLNI